MINGGMTRGLLVKEQSIKNKNKIAVTDGQHSLTFKALYDEAHGLSQHLKPIISVKNWFTY